MYIYGMAAAIDEDSHIVDVGNGRFGNGELQQLIKQDDKMKNN